MEDMQKAQKNLPKKWPFYTKKKFKIYIEYVFFHK